MFYSPSKARFWPIWSLANLNQANACSIVSAKSLFLKSTRREPRIAGGKSGDCIDQAEEPPLRAVRPSHQSRGPNVYRAEEPDKFWIQIALSYLAGACCIGYFFFRV